MKQLRGLGLAALVTLMLLPVAAEAGRMGGGITCRSKNRTAYRGRRHGKNHRLGLHASER